VADLDYDAVEEDPQFNLSSALPEDLPHVPLSTYTEYPEDVMLERSKNFYMEMNRRRTVRYYSSKSIPKEIIENIVRAAGEYGGLNLLEF